MSKQLRIILVFIIVGFATLSIFVIARVLPWQSSRTFSWIASSTRNDSETFTMLFAGDAMFDRDIKKVIVSAQDPLYPLLRIASSTRAADLAIVNLEGPISSRGAKQGSIYSFRFEPVGTMNALQYAGIDIVNVANNHIWDYGADAAADTMTHVAGAGIDYIGFGKNYDEANSPVIKNINETKIVFVGYTEFYGKSAWATSDKLGLSEFDREKIVEKISQLKSTNQADIVVVSMHWGEEYQSRANTNQQELAHAFIDAGADLIIGHHPHVVQETEQYKHGYIAYSLGNFVFDQNFSKDTREGLMVEAVIKDKKIVEFNKLPIKFTPTFQPYLVGE